MSESFLWWRDGVIYQIYPRSFRDSNGDGIGDLGGIVDRMDYLAELGVDAIWLSPIYPSPNVDFGYDVSDYTAIDPMYGTMEEFDELVRQAHRRGIRIVLDMVMNHTSDQHPWFVQSRQSHDSPYRNWYLWKAPRPDGGLPNNWASIFGGPGWQLDPQTGQYYFHMFYKEQPDLNWRNPEVRKAMLNVFRFWLERGVDGFRLDVFNVFFKHPDLPDNPGKLGLRGFDRQYHIYDVDQPEMIPFLKELRQLLDSYPERYAVGETYMSTPEKAAGYCRPGLLHAAFDFSLLTCGWNPERYWQSIKDWEAALAGETWPNYVLNNHDTIRSATRFGKGEDDARMKVAAAFLLTLRGTPFLYYGEEIGMRDIQVARKDIQDPVGRHYWPFFKGRDGCRSPMQWDSSEGAGFGSTQPWLPVNPDYTGRNVASQREDPDSLFNFYRSLITLRRLMPALREGMFQPLTFEPRSLLAYLRQTKDQTVLVALNFGKRPLRLALGSLIQREGWTLVLSSQKDSLAKIKGGWLPLAPYEACIFVQDTPGKPAGMEIE